MLTLADVQRRFAGSIRDRRDEAARLIADDGVPAELRLAIHRNNSYASLVGVLAGAFPRLDMLLGEKRFRSVAASYIDEAPPTRPGLAEYGAGFPAFLERHSAVRVHPWLPDLARLEWARHEAFFAADDAPLTAEMLSRLPVDRYGGLRPRLHSAARWVSARYPVGRLWEASAIPADVQPRTESVLVMRPDLAVMHTVVGSADVAFLEAVAAGQTLDRASAAALNKDPRHDLQMMLAGYLNNAVFSADTLKT